MISHKYANRFTKDKIQSEIEALCAEYLGRPVNQDLCKQITSSVRAFLHGITERQGADDISMIDLRYNFNLENNRLDLFAGNIYTLLIMKGHFVPYWLVKDKIEYQTPEGIYRVVVDPFDKNKIENILIPAIKI